MSTNGHVVAATWRAEDFEELARLNEPLAVDVFEGKRPPIIVDARSYDQLVLEGVHDNPLAQAALEAFYEGRRRSAAAAAKGQELDIAEQSERTWDLQDKILAAVIKQPPYAPKTRIVDGRPPAGHLWYGSFSFDQRRNLIDFFYSGGDAIKHFRQPAKPDGHAVRAGGGVSPTPEQHPDPERPTVSAVVAGRGGADLAAGAGPSGTRDASLVDLQ
jgi:hypothetical protein